jgi:hypothetical protein
MARWKSVGYIRAIVWCPKCDGSTVKLFRMTEHSSSRRVIMPCGHCQLSLEVTLFLRVLPSLPPVEPSQSEPQTA